MTDEEKTPLAEKREDDHGDQGKTRNVRRRFVFQLEDDEGRVTYYDMNCNLIS